jgi:Ca2+-binding EF-hand superfamily protein
MPKLNKTDRFKSTDSMDELRIAAVLKSAEEREREHIFETNTVFSNPLRDEIEMPDPGDALVDIKTKTQKPRTPTSTRLTASARPSARTSSPSGGSKLKSLMIHQRLFNKFDLNGDGLLDAEEIEEMMGGMGFDKAPEYVASVLKRFDTDGSGQLDLKKFEQLWTYINSTNVGSVASANLTDADLVAQRAASAMNRTYDEQQQHIQAESTLRRLYSTRTTSVDDVRQDYGSLSSRVEEMLLEKICNRVNTDGGTGLDREELTELFVQLNHKGDDYTVYTIDRILKEFEFDENDEISIAQLKKWYFGAQTHIKFCPRPPGAVKRP